jgi:hypothetical protein
MTPQVIFACLLLLVVGRRSLTFSQSWRYVFSVSWSFWRGDGGEKILSSRAVTRLRGLVVLPTRDLVVQVRETFEAIAKGRGLKVRSLVLIWLLFISDTTLIRLHPSRASIHSLTSKRSLWKKHHSTYKLLEKRRFHEKGRLIDSLETVSREAPARLTS